MAETTTRGTRVRESLWGRFRRLPAQGLRSAGMIIGALGSPAVLRYGDFLKMVVDVCLMALAAKWSLTTVLGHEFAARNSDVFVLAVLASRVPALGVLRVWKDSWRQARSSDMGRVALGVFLSLPLLVATMHFAQAWGLQVERVPILLATESVFCLVALAAVRFAVRRAASAVYEGDGRTPVLIVGAGAGGAALAYLLEEVGTEYRVVGYLDDDPYKRGRRIRGHRVLGRVADAPAVARASEARLIALAIPSLSPEELRSMLIKLETTGLPVRRVPFFEEMMIDRAKLDDLRELKMEDLLPRPAASLGEGVHCSYLRGKTVLVTGGGGSIGRQVCRDVLAGGAAQLVVLGRGENSVFEAVAELQELDSSCEVLPVICCVRDRASLSRAFSRFRPQIVFHAAAHKHVPLMELYPSEAIKNNVLGTLNVVRLAVEHEIERFVLISTDKAVNPASIMGASKRVAELIVKAFAEDSGRSMVSVRFGNVLGSRGSVVPTFARQIRERHAVTITDPEMVRYFMTIKEASQLILQAAAHGGCGETYILKMGRPVRIIDLACDMIRLAGLTPNVDVPLQITGRRPGEKLYEDLFTHIEEKCVQGRDCFYVVPSAPVSIDRILRAIEGLRQAAEMGDSGLIRSILSDLIPDWMPQRLEPLELPEMVTSEGDGAAGMVLGLLTPQTSDNGPRTPEEGGIRPLSNTGSACTMHESTLRE